MKTNIKRALSICAITAAGLGASTAAHAQLTFQGVTFTPSWSGDTLTLEIDAANPTGDWATATTIGALQIKSIGTWDSVVFSGPGAASSWTVSGQELSATGCNGGLEGNMRVCASGTHVALTDDMIFTYTFTGLNMTSTDPQVKLLMFVGDETQKVGELMSMTVPVIPEPSTYAMLLGGLGILALARRNAKKAA